ncbi:Ig-like domain-containing protein [Curtobacterium flaccumfaciens]|nr:Ig-like domain-containing protein [Curtobacterium flaccumfaciens]
MREQDAATNNPPVPQTVTARVVAGQSVRVSIPLNGVDPDGDSVQLVGVASNPDKGSVTDVAADALTYEAGDYSAGTDEFTYTVVDALGARATGTVRVGIAPRAEQASNPVAEADHVTIRPGGSVTVRVLQNDSDPEGGQLTVTKAEPTAKDVGAKVLRKQQIRVTPPKSAKRGTTPSCTRSRTRTAGPARRSSPSRSTRTRSHCGPRSTTRPSTCRTSCTGRASPSTCSTTCSSPRARPPTSGWAWSTGTATPRARRTTSGSASG